MSSLRHVSPRGPHERAHSENKFVCNSKGAAELVADGVNVLLQHTRVNQHFRDLLLLLVDTFHNLSDAVCVVCTSDLLLRYGGEREISQVRKLGTYLSVR